MLSRTRTSSGALAPAIALIAFGAWAGLAAVPTAAPAWRVDGPDGGPLLGFAIAPSDGSRVYATNFFGEVFRSDDAGRHFAEILRPTPWPLVRLAVDPAHRDRLLAGSCEPECTNVALSEDGGATWRRVLAEQNLFGLQFGAGAAFALTSGGLLRSDDGGLRWTPSGLEGPAIGRLAFDPRHSGTILAGLDGGLRRSTDGGRTWTRRPTPLRWIDVRDLAFDPIRPGAVYAVVERRALRSEDDGATWQVAIPNREVWNLAVLGDGTLLAAPIGPQDDRVYGLLRSTDGGRTWTPSNDPGNPRTARPDDWIFYGLDASPDPSVGLAAGFLGLWRTDDSGATWTPSSRGLAVHSVYALGASAGGEPRVYASTTSGFFARDPRTGAWRKTYRGPILPGAEIRADGFLDLQVDPADSRHLVALDRVEALESSDGGRSWRSFRPFGIASDSLALNRLAIDWNSGTTYVVSSERVSAPQGPIRRQRLDATRDGGATWRRLRPFLPPGDAIATAFAVDPHAPESLWARTAEAGLLHSANGGRTWQRIGRGLPPAPAFYDHYPSALGFDPDDARILLASVPGDGVWRSTDGGFTFRRYGRGLEFSLVTEISGAPDPETGATRWLAGAVGEGVFRLEGDRWKPIGSFPEANLFAGNFAVDPTDPLVIFAGTSGRSVLRLDLERR